MKQIKQIKQINNESANDLFKLKEYFKCKNDPIYFVKNYVYTYNVETQQQERFANFDKEEFKEFVFGLIEKIHNKVTGDKSQKPHLIIEKSRQMYITWIMSAYITWMMLFKEGSQILVTSEKAAKIDKAGDMNTLLGRVDYIVKYLPTWLQPATDDYVNSLLHRGIKSINTMIVGDAGTEPGRAGSYDLTIADEFAFQSFTHLKFASMIEATKKCIVLISTPNGKHNKFYELQKIAKENKNSNFEVITLHWSLRRSKEWYELQKQNYIGNEAALLQELEIKYDTVTSNKVFKYFDAIKHVVDVNGIKFDEYYIGADFGWSDPTAMVIIGKSKEKYYVIDELEINETPVELIASELKKRLSNLGIDSNKVIWYGDPSGISRGRETGISFFDLYSKYGIRFLEANNDIEQGIVSINTLFASNKLYISKNCNRTMDALSEAVYHVDRAGNIVGNKYKDDWYIHILDALRYACVMVDRYNPIRTISTIEPVAINSAGSKMETVSPAVYRHSIFKDYFKKKNKANAPVIINLT